MSPITWNVTRSVILVGTTCGASLSHSTLKTSESVSGRGCGSCGRWRSAFLCRPRYQIRLGNSPWQARHRGSARDRRHCGLSHLPALVGRLRPGPGWSTLGLVARGAQSRTTAAEPVRFGRLEDRQPVVLLHCRCRRDDHSAVRRPVAGVPREETACRSARRRRAKDRLFWLVTRPRGGGGLGCLLG